MYKSESLLTLEEQYKNQLRNEFESFVKQELQKFPGLTGVESIRFTGDISGIDRVVLKWDGWLSEEGGRVNVELLNIFRSFGRDLVSMGMLGRSFKLD